MFANVEITVMDYPLALNKAQSQIVGIVASRQSLWGNESSYYLEDWTKHDV